MRSERRDAIGGHLHGSRCCYFYLLLSADAILSNKREAISESIRSEQSGTIRNLPRSLRGEYILSYNQQNG